MQVRYTRLSRSTLPRVVRARTRTVTRCLTRPRRFTRARTRPRLRNTFTRLPATVTRVPLTFSRPRLGSCRRITKLRRDRHVRLPGSTEPPDPEPTVGISTWALPTWITPAARTGP